MWLMIEDETTDTVHLVEVDGADSWEDYPDPLEAEDVVID